MQGSIKKTTTLNQQSINKQSPEVTSDFQYYTAKSSV